MECSSVVYTRRFWRHTDQLTLEWADIYLLGANITLFSVVFAMLRATYSFGKIMFLVYPPQLEFVSSILQYTQYDAAPNFISFIFYVELSLLIAWSCVFLEQSIAAHILKHLPEFYATRLFVTVFTLP
jgi:hypothetical protein